MPSETFYCPQCRRQLTKSAQAYVMGEVLTGGGGFIGLGAPAKTVNCPGCGAAIDAMAMMRGEYDSGMGGGEAFAALLALGLVLWLTIWVLGWAWWLGGLLAVCSFPVGMAIGRAFGGSKRG